MSTRGFFMKKNIFFSAVFGAVLVLTSCGGGGSHTHVSDGEWYYEESAKGNHWQICRECHEMYDINPHRFEDTVIEPTYDLEGYTLHECSVCGYSYKDSYVDPLEHHYSNAWTYDENGHYHACTDEGYEDLSKDYAGHDYEESIVEPTFDEYGYYKYTCKVCGYYVIGQTINKKEHTYSDEYSYDDNYHYYACTDEGYEDLRKDVYSHYFSNYELTKSPTETEDGEVIASCYCGYTKTIYIDSFAKKSLNQILTFELSEDETYYIVTKIDSSVYWYGSFDDYSYTYERKVLVIPDMYDGLPVKEIAPKACQRISGYNKRFVNFDEIIIGDNVEVIGEEAFYNDDAYSYEQYLTKVTLGKNVRIIGDNAFSRNENLAEFNLPEGLEKVGECAFLNGAYSLPELPTSLKYIGSSAFYANTNTEITIPETEYIEVGTDAFGKNIEVVHWNAKNGKTLPDRKGATNDSYAYQQILDGESVAFDYYNAEGGVFEYEFFWGDYIFGSKTREIYFGEHSLGSYPYFVESDVLEKVVIYSNVFDSTSIKSSSTSFYNQTENGYYLGNEDNPYYVLAKVVDTSVTSFTVSDDCVKIMDNAFKDTSVTTITFGKNVNYFSKKALGLDNHTVSKFVVPSSNPNLLATEDGKRIVWIAGDTLVECPILCQLDYNMSKNLSLNTAVIDSYAFANCQNLTNVSLSENVQQINSFAFYNCKEINYLVINPVSNMNAILKDAFFGCSASIKLYCSLSDYLMIYFESYASNPIYWNTSGFDYTTYYNNFESIGDFNSYLPYHFINGIINNKDLSLSTKIVNIPKHTFVNFRGANRIYFEAETISVDSYAFYKTSSFGAKELIQEVDLSNATIIGDEALSNYLIFKLKLGSKLEQFGLKTSMKVSHIIMEEPNEHYEVYDEALYHIDSKTLIRTSTQTKVVRIKEGTTKILDNAIMLYDAAILEIPASLEGSLMDYGNNSAFDSDSYITYVKFAEGIKNLNVRFFGGNVSTHIRYIELPSTLEVCYADSSYNYFAGIINKSSVELYNLPEDRLFNSEIALIDNKFLVRKEENGEVALIDVICGEEAEEDITIPSIVTYIEYKALFNENTVKVVRIGKNVTKLCQESFLISENITDIYYEGTIEEWNAIEKDGSWFAINGLVYPVIHCSDGDITNW